jgi:glutamyl-tRNA synthetase
MGWATPKWLHLPLIVGIDGKRLAKRHGDSRISTFRTLGVSPERIIGLLAMWTATQQEREPMTLETFTNTFTTQTLQESNIVLTQEDEAWLLE